MRVFVVAFILVLLVGSVFAASVFFRDSDSAKSSNEYRANTEKNTSGNTGRAGNSDSRYESRSEGANRSITRREFIDAAKREANETARAKEEARKHAFERQNKTAAAALEKVRERHKLSEECREMTGENRSSCEKRVNAIFRNETAERFKEFVKSRKSGNFSEENETETGMIKENHKEKFEEFKAKLNSTAKQKLIDRFEKAIEEREKREGKMQLFIDRAKEKGHDTVELEFVLGEYKTALLNAQTYMDDGKYKDALSSLQESNKLFTEFKRTVEKIVKEQKQKKKHTVSENESFSEEEDSGVNSTAG